MDVLHQKFTTHLLSDFFEQKKMNLNQAIKIIDLKAEAQEQNKKTKKFKIGIRRVLKKDSIQNGSALNAIKLKYDELSSTYDLLASKQ